MRKIVRVCDDVGASAGMGVRLAAVLSEVKTTETIGDREVEKRGYGPDDLQPSFWRTVRALKNVNRLNLLREVFRSDGSRGVVAIARAAGVSEPQASVFLRMLNARGIIGVTRDDRFVFYDTRPDRSLPQAFLLQEGFRDFFAGPLKKGWQLTIIAILDGFTHYNRINIIRYLAVQSESTRSGLLTAAGLCEKNFEHHLSKLKRAGLVSSFHCTRAQTLYRLADQTHPIARVLLAAATLDLVRAGGRT